MRKPLYLLAAFLIVIWFGAWRYLSAGPLIHVLLAIAALFVFIQIILRDEKL